MHYFSTTVTFPSVIVHFQKVFSAVNIHEYQHCEDRIFISVWVERKETT